MARKTEKENTAARLLGLRIAQARKKVPGLTQEKLALLIGAAGQSTVGNWERGENQPDIDAIRRIAEVTGQPIAALTAIDSPPTAREDGAAYAVSPDKYAFIRRYDVEAGAGRGTENGHEEVSGTHAYRRDWLEKRGLIAAACVVIDVRGESMEPTICDGDVVLINTADKRIRNGHIYAFRTEDGVRLKRLHRQLDGRVRVTSDNANKNAFADEWLTPDSEATMIGLVVHRAGGV